MELSIKELRLLIEALGTLDAEYGRPDAVELEARVREVLERRKAEASAY
jgi:hypothetical protein